MKSTSSFLHGFILTNGEVIENLDKMCKTVAEYYKDFFKKPKNIYRPHPDTNTSKVEWKNYDEEIPSASVDEIFVTPHTLPTE
jgi:hypothetical protein